jgi:maleate isomerase
MNPEPESGPRLSLRRLPFALDAGIAHRAAIGLIVLATDHTIEHEWRAMLRLDGVGFYHSRLLNAPDINPQTLHAMEARITEAAGLIRPGERIDAIAFACTSGALVIGDHAVAARVRAARPRVACTTPMEAAIAAFAALGVRRIALLTPYVDELNRMMRAHLVGHGIDVPVMGSFNHANDNEVARIDAASIERAVLALGREADVEAVFVSCTSLRLAGQVEHLESLLNKPVTSSNHALAWRALRLAGCPDAVPGFGRLMRL